MFLTIRFQRICHLAEKGETVNRTFAQEESRCEFVFTQLGPCWHLYTPENHPVMMTDIADFKAGMTLLAICAFHFPSIRILTFQWMSNHLHITLAGPEEDIVRMFAMLKKYLANYLKMKDYAGSMDGWECRLRQIGDLHDLRNVIAYNNRNGFLVSSDHTPFNYPWGANRCFFNPDAKARFMGCRETISCTILRESFRTHKFDGFAGKPYMDGIIPPQAFCDITSAEALFRNARHYFSQISKNLEGMRSVAKEIGESLCYTDDDLFSILLGISRDQYGAAKPAFLPTQAKIELARKMHFEYNAGVKQIARMLKVDQSVLAGVIPISR